ncbi:MAG: response regulator transcription factor [Fodinibius sp.]|nr:response regulator transcription factor [Fodinibius sp.]
MSAKHRPDDECIQLFKENNPDICLLDIGMPGINGIETAQAIRKLDHRIKILILSMHINKRILKDVLEAGINGYLLKNTDKADLLTGIRAVMKGQQVFSDPISDLIKESFLTNNNLSPPESKRRLPSVSRKYCNLLSNGLTSKEIAQKLYISPRTVDTHRANLMEKLELNNIAELVRYAIKHELVSG